MARILIVEDEPLISLLLEDWLLELGHEPVGPVATLAAAVEMAREGIFEAAILDIQLRQLRSDAVAEILLARQIPFAVSSGGCGDPSDLTFAGQPRLPKPYEFEAMRLTVEQLLSRANHCSASVGSSSTASPFGNDAWAKQTS